MVSYNSEKREIGEHLKHVTLISNVFLEGNCRLKKLLYYELALVNLNGENATCKSAPEIRDLAQEILSPEKFEEAFRIAE